jgi:hypothetical protein
VFDPCAKSARFMPHALARAGDATAHDAPSGAAHAATATAAYEQEEGAAQQEVSGATLLCGAMIAYALMWVVKTLAVASNDK